MMERGSIFKSWKVNGAMSYKNKRKSFNTIIFVVMLAASVLMLLPFLWMLSTSLKLENEVFEYPIRWIPGTLRWQNYVEVWTKVPFWLYYLNTIKLSVVITVLQLITCSMAAYAFARLKFRFKNVLFAIFLSTMMIPWQTVMIPQFIIVHKLGLYDTHMGLMMLFIFSAFGIFLLRQFFLGIPFELNDAAKIDGCSEWGIYWRIMLPLSKPGLSTLGVFTFIFVWNDYLAPLIYLNKDSLKTIQLGLKYFQSEHSMEYGLMMAGTVSAILPMLIIFMFGEKYFTKGIVFSGIKG